VSLALLLYEFLIFFVFASHGFISVPTMLILAVHPIQKRQLIRKNHINITELYEFIDCQFFTSEINFDSSRFVHFLHISAFHYNKMIYSCLYWKPWQLILISDLKLMILYQTFFYYFLKKCHLCNCAAWPSSVPSTQNWLKTAPLFIPDTRSQWRWHKPWAPYTKFL
jgi:hypothetical protein